MRLPWILRTTLTLAVIAAPVFWYIGRRLSTALAGRFDVAKKRVLKIVFAVILWFYLYPIVIVIYYLTGNMRYFFIYEPQPGWPDYLLLYPFWWGFIAVVEAASYFVALDIIGLIGRWKIFSFAGDNAKKSRKERWYKVQEYLKMGIIVCCLVYVAACTYIDTNRVRCTRYEIEINNLPAELQNLNICLTGDIHMDRFSSSYNLEKLNEALESEIVDMQFFSGDLVSEGTDSLPAILKMMCRAKSKIANIACMGDHDYWSAPQQIAEKMSACGWSFLQNQHHLFSYKGKKILATGVTMVYSRRTGQYELESLLARAPAADLKILVVHQPLEYVVETAARYGYYLVLGGHTHAGQIVPHALGLRITPTAMETQYFSGYYRYRDTHIIVNNGIGLTLAPLRYHAPSEITSICLKKKQ